jgi:SAM-dependent methyltransferase
LSSLEPLIQRGDASSLAREVRAARDAHPLPPVLSRFAARVPEWLFSRNGDLATVFWLAHQEHERDLDLVALVLAIAAAFFDAGRDKDAFCLLRFLVDVDFDFGEIMKERGPAYGFFQEREPNPLLWKLLEHYDQSAEPLKILELGCGIGNDALGFLSSAKVESFTGIDISPDALGKLTTRTQEHASRVTTIAGDFSEVLEQPAAHALERTNLIYSYSSLHYFNSTQLSEILTRAHRILEQNGGSLAFAIKGAGSIWDGQGVPLYRPDVWINWDGQSRWFPSVRAVDKLLERHGYAPAFHETHEHWGYSERGRRDLFHYVLARAI